MATMTRTRLQNFIDGELVDAADGATEEVTNPANGEAMSKYALDDYTEIKHVMVNLEA